MLLPMMAVKIPDPESISLVGYIENEEKQSSTISTGIDALTLYLRLAPDVPKTLDTESVIESGM